ncbi:3-phosphoshikimate 1-carboxyvinyltransferase [soil metagenome]
MTGHAIGRDTPTRNRQTVLMTDPWPAPFATGPVRATVALPGSKSMTNRALVLAALGTDEAVVGRPLRARDTLLMAAGLRAMGAEITDEGADWLIHPGALRGPAAVDVGNAGTVLRFLPVVAALADGAVRFEGDARAAERPLGPVLRALRSLGARIEGCDTLPATIVGTCRLAGGEVALDALASSQFVSALLLAAPRFDEGVVVRHAGPPVPSMPHIEMTVAMLRAAGAIVETGPDLWAVKPGDLHRPEWDIEPDLSNAAPFLAAAPVTGGRVDIPGWPEYTTQAGAALPVLLRDMGAEVEHRDGTLRVTGTGRLQGLSADLHDVGELTPVLAAVCALASSPSRLHGIAHLRAHETDRLAALAGEINALGGQVRETGDGLSIWPSPLHGGVVSTYDDHRMATAAAVLGLAVEGIAVRDIGTTAKTLPDFPAMWAAMLGEAR